MKKLYVLYDAECGICQRCRVWLIRQRAYFELHFIPLQSSEVAWRFPGLKEWPELDLREKLVVIGDEGAVYQGQSAWIMCLYALRDYREWSLRLADPALLPLARAAVRLGFAEPTFVITVLQGTGGKAGGGDQGGAGVLRECRGM